MWNCSWTHGWMVCTLKFVAWSTQTLHVTRWMHWPQQPQSIDCANSSTAISNLRAYKYPPSYTFYTENAPDPYFPWLQSFNVAVFIVPFILSFMCKDNSLVQFTPRHSGTLRTSCVCAYISSPQSVVRAVLDRRLTPVLRAAALWNGGVVPRTDKATLFEFTQKASSITWD